MALLAKREGIIALAVHHSCWACRPGCRPTIIANWVGGNDVTWLPSSPPTARPGARRVGLGSPPSGDPRGFPNARVQSYLRRYAHTRVCNPQQACCGAQVMFAVTL